MLGFDVPCHVGFATEESLGLSIFIQASLPVAVAITGFRNGSIASSENLLSVCVNCQGREESSATESIHEDRQVQDKNEIRAGVKEHLLVT